VTRTFRRSAELTQRAAQVIPNGVFGHRRMFAFAGGQSLPIPDEYPHFVARAEGCRFWDVDGNSFIDYLCGFGPMIVGYGNEQVEAAAAAERALGSSYTFPAVTSVAVAERLVAAQRDAAWATFALNGTDVISMALVVARAATGRELVVIADGAFHGNVTWASQGLGWSAQDQVQTRTVPFGDAAALAEVVETERVAAVVLCPYEQVVGAENRMAPDGYWDAVRVACSRTGAQLIVDDIRSGYRVGPAGSCAHLNIRPDLLAQSKAMANGYPIAALIGAEHLREAASSVFVTGTYWGYAPSLAACMATLDLLCEPGAHERLEASGRRLTDGLVTLAAEHGHELLVSGPPALPHVRFAADADYAMACAFAQRMAAEGSLVHPTHNWFLSLAHAPDDIDRTLEHAAAALRGLPAPVTRTGLDHRRASSPATPRP
jgi:glutamate-1-semialdehyde 2,1-aminomutase